MRSKLVLLSSPTSIVSKSSSFGSDSYLGMAEADDQIGNPASASEGQRERHKEECTESYVPKEERQGKHHGGKQTSIPQSLSLEWKRILFVCYTMYCIAGNF